MICNALANFLFALYKGFEKLEYETTVTLYSNVGLFMIVVFLVLLNANVFIISIAFALSRIAGFVIGIYYSYKLLPGISYKLFFNNIKIVRKKVLTFGFHLLFNSLYFQIDTVLLASWKGDYDAGIYQSVFKLILLPLVLPDIMANVLTPTLSRLNIDNPQQWKKIGHLTNKILLFIGIPISMVLFVYSEQIIELLYGLDQYRDAVIVLRILSVMLCIRFTFETYSLILTTSGRQHVRMWVVIAATGMNLLLNYFFIPKYGAYGSALVSLICNSFVGIAYGLASILLFVEWDFNYKTMGLCMVSVFIGVVVWNYRAINMFFGIPVLLALFSLIAYYYYFSKEEKAVLLSSEFGFTLVKK
jgi:O-antigen/teichoic acid export membrane protein